VGKTCEGLVRLEEGGKRRRKRMSLGKEEQGGRR
jgi:hypothetical protein